MRYFSCILFLLLFSACLVQFVGITNDYNKLTKSEKNKIKKLEDFSSIKNEFIYELTGFQLMKDLVRNEKSLVYIFANNCNSKNCLPLKSVIKYAAQNKQKLYLVMDGYTHLEQTVKQNISVPIFAINSDYYKSKLSSIYNKKFEIDIGLVEFLGDNKYLGRFIFFERNKIVDVRKIL